LVRDKLQFNFIYKKENENPVYFDCSKKNCNYLRTEFE